MNQGGFLGSEHIPVNKALDTVLFVDDDRFTQTLVSTTLEDRFNVVNETSGAQAIATAEKCRPQLILLDLLMPNVDGYEVLMRLKNHPILSSVPVICLSGKKDESSRDRAYKLGASGFIQKPVDVKRLSKDIEDLLESMNTEMSSSDGKRTVFVGYNNGEIYSKLKSDIEKIRKNKRSTLILSFAEGETFFSHFNDEEAKGSDANMVYLQIKPTFITRLPYLENLSSITAELKTLIEGQPEDYNLLFEGPESAFGDLQSEKSKASALLLGQALAQIFPKVHYYMETSSDSNSTRKIHELSKLLLGNF